MSSDSSDRGPSNDGAPDINGAPGDAPYRRSWPFVLLGGGLALIIGLAIWAFWLSPGQPVVDPAPVTPTNVATESATPTTTTSTSPTATPKKSATPLATSSAEPTDVVNNPIDDAIVGYPGKPLKRTSSTVPQDVVKVVQQRLIDLNYSVQVDGIFGARTELAVKKFQKDNALVADGVVGRATWAALFTSDGG